jgi:hypothetical protein
MLLGYFHRLGQFDVARPQPLDYNLRHQNHNTTQVKG